MTEPQQSLPHPIAAYRQQLGVSQKTFAERVGCKRWMINRIERGERTPSPALASRIQRETGIDARKIMGIPLPEEGAGQCQ